LRPVSAFAAGLAMLALGTDIAGSVRIPASCRGIVGLKASFGRIPRVPADNAFVTQWYIGDAERRFQELCLEVEAVQLEQLVLLRCLIRHHGLRRAYCEGLTEKDMATYKERIAALQMMEREQAPQLRRQLEEVRGLKPGAKAAELEAEIVALLEEHRLNLLEVGAPG